MADTYDQLETELRAVERDLAHADTARLQALFDEVRLILAADAPADWKVAEAKRLLS